MQNNYATISDVNRQRIIEASLSGESASMIANVMGVKRTSDEMRCTGDEMVRASGELRLPTV